MATKTTAKPSRAKAAKSEPPVAARWDVVGRGRCVHRSDACCSLCVCLQEMVERAEKLLDVLDNAVWDAACGEPFGCAHARRELRGEISEAKRQLGRS